MRALHVLAAFASALNSSPTVTPSHMLATRGMTVQVTATRFAPSTVVTLAVDTAPPLAAGTTNAAGALTLTVRIPLGESAGDHTLIASGASGIVAQAPLVVVAPLQGRIVNASFRSRALLGVMHAAAYLPPGYSRGGGPYPVLYFLHGLPADGTSYLRRARSIAQLVEAVGRPAIVVLPQGARDRDPDPEYADWGAGRNWERAVSVELPAYVDRHFRTIRGRGARAIIGVSAGGYGAAICGLHHLSTFSVIESWSGYFRPTDPTGRYVISRGSPQADAASSVFAAVTSLANTFAAQPTSFSFYVGDSDRKFKPDNVMLDSQLTAAGVAHEFQSYPGGHSWSLWDAHAERWLRAALEQLGGPAGTRTTGRGLP